MVTAAAANKTAVEDETEAFRQLVIAARNDPKVGPAADKCLTRLNALFAEDPGLFSVEDVRWLNVLRGYLGVRLAAHGPKVKQLPRPPKVKGDKLDNCWRCETPADARFTNVCPDCDSKAYHWRVCPVCQACGCQKGRKVLV